MLDARPLPPPSLLPLNVMPFPNINDPASTSALDVEDEYLNSAAKMADPSTMVSTFSPRQPAARDLPLQHGPDRRPGTRQLQEPPRGASAEADATRERAPAGLIALPARALPAPSSRVQQPRARVCMLPVRTRGRVPRGTTPSRGPRPRPQARLAAHAPGPAPPATAPEHRVDAVQQRGLHALQPRARGTAHPDDPIHASVYAGAEDLDVRPIHCFPDAPPFNIPESERKAARAPHRYRRGGTLWQQNTAATCARLQIFRERHVPAHKSANLLAAIALSHDFQKWKLGG
ncbi:hypothetical protein GGX14DRAFT_586878 [Mycena pura]|uniref:Uncharacterized protein n=1 Tax=Mycena pura TaxID=153505 RepID=A0AAD6UTM8_9AGAR|nr:hypothetical protein GGX14DRAFT_586878 [Mycena pura]